MNNQIIAQDGAKSMIIRQSPKNGEKPKGGRPTNEYRLTGTPLPEMAKETRQNWRIEKILNGIPFRLGRSPKMRSEKAYSTSLNFSLLIITICYCYH